MTTERPEPKGYDPLYATFESPLMRRIRREAYGEDIGQHSWVTADDLRADLERLELGPSSRLLDLGCGPCGPLVFAVRSTGCEGVGVDSSAAAIASGKSRAVESGVGNRIVLHQADLERRLPVEDRAFDAAISLDVVLHLGDRSAFFKEAARVLRPGGRLLLTDAGVITGAISSEEIAHRSVQGATHLAPVGFNEELLGRAGLRILRREDRTASAVLNANGRRNALMAHRQEWEQMHGAEALARQLDYLAAVIALSERRALSRVAYLAEAT